MLFYFLFLHLFGKPSFICLTRPDVDNEKYETEHRKYGVVA